MAELQRRGQGVAPGGNPSGGFTMVELVIAVAIVGVVAVGALSAVAFAARATQLSSIRNAAINLANQRIEYARNLPYDSMGVVGGEPAGILAASLTTDTPVATFTVTQDVEWIRGLYRGVNRAKVKHIAVTVSWTQGIPGSVSVATDIYGKTNLTNVGDVSIIALIAGSSTPLPGALVTIQPASGPPRNLSTDSNGEAFFGQVAGGPITTEVSLSGYVFNMAPVSGATVAPDTLNSWPIYGEIPSTVNIHVIGTPSGSNIQDATVTLTDSGSHSLTRTTPSDGIATFTDLLMGTYTFGVTATGRNGVSGRTLVISASGSTVSTDVALTDPADLTVRVVDGGGAVQGSASVRVRGPSPSTADVPGSPKTTPASGEASFSSLLDGTYSITVQKTGFDNGTASTTLAGLPKTEVVTILPPQTGSILITVKNKNGSARSGVPIRYYDPATSSYRTVGNTNSSGQVLISNLLARSGYRVQYRYGNSTWKPTSGSPAGQPVSVPAGGQALVTFTYQ